MAPESFTLLAADGYAIEGFFWRHYRGIGESRPATLRGFDASWIDWGRLDFDAVPRHAERSFPGQPIHVVGPSIGGFVLGLAESNHLIRRVFTMGAQYACWRDRAFSRERIENAWRGYGLEQQFAGVTAPTLALSATDDELGTARAVERPLAYFPHSPAAHLRISPRSLESLKFGHVPTIKEHHGT